MHERENNWQLSLENTHVVASPTGHLIKTSFTLVRCCADDDDVLYL